MNQKNRNESRIKNKEKGKRGEKLVGMKERWKRRGRCEMKGDTYRNGSQEYYRRICKFWKPREWAKKIDLNKAKGSRPKRSNSTFHHLSRLSFLTCENLIKIQAWFPQLLSLWYFTFFEKWQVYFEFMVLRHSSLDGWRWGKMARWVCGPKIILIL